jgi:hypothetical protein
MRFKVPKFAYNQLYVIQYYFTLTKWCINDTIDKIKREIKK